MYVRTYKHKVPELSSKGRNYPAFCTPVLCSVLHFFGLITQLKNRECRTRRLQHYPIWSLFRNHLLVYCLPALLLLSLPLLLLPLPPPPPLPSPLRLPHGDTVAKIVSMANHHDIAPRRICQEACLLGQEGDMKKKRLKRELLLNLLHLLHLQLSK